MVFPRAGLPVLGFGASAGAEASCSKPLVSSAAPERKSQVGGVVSIGVTSMLEAGFGAKPEDVHTEGPALPAEVTGRLGDKGVLGVATGTSPAAGCGEDHKGSEASQS